jgi:hypothetical protein
MASENPGLHVRPREVLRARKLWVGDAETLVKVLAA